MAFPALNSTTMTPSRQVTNQDFEFCNTGSQISDFGHWERGCCRDFFRVAHLSLPLWDHKLKSSFSASSPLEDASVPVIEPSEPLVATM